MIAPPAWMRTKLAALVAAPNATCGEEVPKPLIHTPRTSLIGSVVSPSEPTLIVALLPMTIPLGL